MDEIISGENSLKTNRSPEATALKPAFWKQGVSKWRNLKRPIYHALNSKSKIKLIFNTVQPYNFDINEFNLTYAVQNMANGVFQIAPFGIAPFPNGRFECSYLWAITKNSLDHSPIFSTYL